MLQEAEFHILADRWLTTALEALEEADASGAIEADMDAGSLTIGLPSGKTLLASKHTPSRQIWLSSPIKGGLHFSWNGSTWALPDGRLLGDILSADLEALAQLKVHF